MTQAADAESRRGCWVTAWRSSSDAAINRATTSVQADRLDGGQVAADEIVGVGGQFVAVLPEVAPNAEHAAQARGHRIGRPPVARHIVGKIEALAASTDLSIRQIEKEIAGKASRGVIGQITKRVREGSPSSL